VDAVLDALNPDDMVLGRMREAGFEFEVEDITTGLGSCWNKRFPRKGANRDDPTDCLTLRVHAIHVKVRASVTWSAPHSSGTIATIGHAQNLVDLLLKTVGDVRVSAIMGVDVDDLFSLATTSTNEDPHE
jgi:hypothetical protein